LTIVTTNCKNICVPDASSLIFSGQVELKGKEVLEWLLEHYTVYISPEVKVECFNRIQKDRPELINLQKFKNHVSQRVALNVNYKHCLEYLIEHCCKNQMLDFPKQHPGEMHSLALSLYLNAKLKKPIVLLIDDFPAIQAFAKTINDQKFAIQMSVPDIIINFFKTEPDLDENETAASLQTYYNIMTKAVHYKTFKMRFEQSCRHILFQKCSIKCLF
jgi:hypothetical protein